MAISAAGNSYDLLSLEPALMPPRCVTLSHACSDALDEMKGRGFRQLITTPVLQLKPLAFLETVVPHT